MLHRRAFISLPLLGPALPALAQTPERATPPSVALARHWQSGLSLADWWVSEKYDGIRAWWDGQHLLSRNGRMLAAPPSFTAGWPRVPLDGELWAGRGGFERVQSIAMRQQPDEAAWQTLRFMVFDMPAHGGDFNTRLAALQASLNKTVNPVLQAAPQQRVANEAALKKLLRQVTAGGGEGLVLQRGSADYTAGRSGHVLKLKNHQDDEARVVAHLPGTGKNAKRLGALLVETPQGQRFKLGSGFSDALRQNPPPVGSWVTYRYRDVHPQSGLPRFASFVRVRELGL